MDRGSDLSFKALDGFLLVRISGNYTSYEESLSVLRQIADSTRNASCTEFLLDVTALNGIMLNVDRFRLILAFARMLPPRIAIAVLVAREHHISDYLLETILRKYEVEGEEFVDRDAAIAWLNRQREPAQRAV